MESFDDLKFRDFIRNLLMRAKINVEYQDLFTDTEGMHIFKQAFISSQIDPEYNYEHLEFFGDGMLKAIMSDYIYHRFGDVHVESGPNRMGKTTNEGLFTKIRKNLEQSKMLGETAYKMGFAEFVIAPPEALELNRQSTLEDIFEAFIGAMCEVINKKARRGLGYTFAYNFIESIFNEVKIDLSVEALNDPVSLLTKMYKAQPNQLMGHKYLNWGDAIADKGMIYLRKVREQDLEKYKNLYPSGPQVVFVVRPSGQGGSAKFYDPQTGRWLLLTQIDPHKLLETTVDGLKIRKFEPAPDKTRPDSNIQHLYFFYYWGFDAPNPNPDTQLITAENKKQFSINPMVAPYRAKIIGFGFDFTDKKAKAAAAQMALTLLESKGYRFRQNIHA